MRQAHARKPVTLNPAADDAWLDLLTPAAEVKPLLARNLDSDLESPRQPHRQQREEPGRRLCRADQPSLNVRQCPVLTEVV